MPVVAPDNPVPDIKWWHTATVYQVYKKLYGNRSSRPPASSAACRPTSDANCARITPSPFYRT